MGMEIGDVIASRYLFIEGASEQASIVVRIGRP
jgi:hypothetical protein